MASFNEIVRKVLNIEGGYTDDPTDKGNWVCTNKAWPTGDYPDYKCANGDKPLLVGTNRGIAAPVLAAWLNKVPSVQQMKTLTEQTAIDIFEVNFWKKIKGDHIQSQEVANIFLDGAINHGSNKATKLMQETLNSIGKNVSVDGVVGPNTLNAINHSDAALLHNQYKDRREQFYYAIVSSRPSQQKYLNGWLNRLKKFPDLIGSSDHNPTTDTSPVPAEDIGVVDAVDIVIEEVTDIIQEALPIPKNKTGFQIIKTLLIIAGIVTTFFLGWQVFKIANKN